MLISQLAGRAGVTSKTLRYYERIGVLPAPSRLASGYRDYRPDVHDRLAFIRAGQAIGLSLGEIRQVIALRDRGEPPCDHVYRLLQQRTAELNERIDDLQRLSRELQMLTRRARHLDPADCNPQGVCHLIRSGVDRDDATPRSRSATTRRSRLGVGSRQARSRPLK